MNNKGDFTDDEWKLIFDELDANSVKYGLPPKQKGSARLGSFNIRKLGAEEKRTDSTWKFLGQVCNSFDLLAVQESLDDISGLRRLKKELDSYDEWYMICSDVTGVYPGDGGVGERLAFLYRASTIERGEVTSDVTYDRSKVSEIVFEKLDELNATKAEYEKKMEEYESGKRKGKPKLALPFFLSFIRQPFCSSFRVKSENPGEENPYSFMAVNAHLIYGKSQERWAEFVALMNWIRDRVEQKEKAYYPNFILLGDLNLDFDNPEKDIKKLESLTAGIDEDTPNEVNINFPFLSVHPHQTEHFTSNVLLSQRYDQIGIFFRDDDGQGVGFPTKEEHKNMGSEGFADYGVFNFSDLFAKALTGKTFKELEKKEQKHMVKRYEHEVSDHMPIWLRLQLPHKDNGNKRKASEISLKN